jgi:lipopolysaccharide export LptBFGC system permease protein LptF
VNPYFYATSPFLALALVCIGVAVIMISTGRGSVGKSLLAISLSIISILLLGELLSLLQG